MSDREENLRIAIIGGGPAGLMAAEIAAGSGLNAAIFEAKPSLGRKFLVAGKGGLNLTHSESQESFLSRYSDRQDQLKPFLDAFGPDELREWAQAIGFETFVGSSGRVFPVGMQAAPLLRAWIQRLERLGVRFFKNHRWSGWNAGGGLQFATKAGNLVVKAEAVILAMGGASWPNLGSDGSWVSILADKGIDIIPLEPANCGFNVSWSDHLRTRFAGAPLKSVVLTFNCPDGSEFKQRGEFVITEHGVEGSLIYAASKWIRETIHRDGNAEIFLDLAPDLSEVEMGKRLGKPRGSKTLSTHLQRQAGIKGVKSALLHEVTPPEIFRDPVALAGAIKRLPVRLLSPRPIDEAISTAGGVPFEELDGHLMLKKLPGVFCAGEMLDWEAPTGGYLLTASISTGRAAGEGAVRWLRQDKS